MSFTKKIILIPTNANSFLVAQKAVTKALRTYYIHKAKAFIATDPDIQIIPQLALRCKTDDSKGIWRAPNVSSMDFVSFSTVFAVGEENSHSLFTCETNDKQEGTTPSENLTISFILSDWGLVDEILDVVGHVCAEFGETVKTNNDDDIIERYEAPEKITA